ncbi:hypothetical protein BJV82DRAFT_584303 [Fennellomyces sp. T-0311]|nr:hypothetical protein BJV82DRAFT_584303 [Fennellomyces sp. T-0311]
MPSCIVGILLPVINSLLIMQLLSLCDGWSCVLNECSLEHKICLRLVFGLYCNAYPFSRTMANLFLYGFCDGANVLHAAVNLQIDSGRTTKSECEHNHGQLVRASNLGRQYRIYQRLANWLY